MRRCTSAGALRPPTCRSAPSQQAAQSIKRRQTGISNGLIHVKEAEPGIWQAICCSLLPGRSSHAGCGHQQQIATEVPRAQHHAGRMKVLFTTTEFADLAKVGGLGDVSASLPRALKRRGVDVRILVPAYPEMLARNTGLSISAALPRSAALPSRAEIPECRIAEAQTRDGLTVYLVVAPSLYERDGSPYCSAGGPDWRDNDLRFARLSLAAAEVAQGRAGLSWVPDVLHVNDWPGALAPAYMRWDGASVRTILTIHNIAYQGIFDMERRHSLGIPESAFDMYGVEFHDRLSFLKAGIFYADQVVTVSPRYAGEITTKALGAGLHGLMRTLAAEGRLCGILNGIDDSWNPEQDPHLPRHFATQDLSGKHAIADVVRTALCLKQSDGPLFGVVSRLVHQKGLDVVAEVADAIVKEGGQIAILGLGDPETEHMLSRVARSRRDHVALLNGFNEAMARRIVAASDFLLMPSRFEPCGLMQMQAQRYGALPIAHATGGLADTIEDGKTGFLFWDLSPSGLYSACRRAFEAFADEAVLKSMCETAMSRRFSWSDAAEQYEALYRRSLWLPSALRLRPPIRRPVQSSRPLRSHPRQCASRGMIGHDRRGHLSPRVARDTGSCRSPPSADRRDLIELDRVVQQEPH